MALNSQITSMSDLIAGSLSSGNGAMSGSLGGDAPAFAWASGLLPTLADHVSTATSTGMSAPVTLVTESGTPAAVVAEGALKPSAVTITPDTVDLQKHAGYAEAPLEAFLNASNLADAIQSVLNTSCLRSFETAGVASLAAGAGQSVTTAADWVSAVAEGQALVLAAGAVPGVLVVSAQDYAALIGDVLGTTAFATSPESPVGSILGLPIHVSVGAPAGFGYVMDSNAAVAVQHSRSPVVVADPYSGSSQNKTKLVLDLLASVYVAYADGIVKITAPTGAMAAASTKRK